MSRPSCFCSSAVTEQASFCKGCAGRTFPVLLDPPGQLRSTLSRHSSCHQWKETEFRLQEFKQHFAACVLRVRAFQGVTKKPHWSRALLHAQTVERTGLIRWLPNLWLLLKMTMMLRCPPVAKEGSGKLLPSRSPARDKGLFCGSLLPVGESKTLLGTSCLWSQGKGGGSGSCLVPGGEQEGAFPFFSACPLSSFKWHFIFFFLHLYITVVPWRRVRTPLGYLEFHRFPFLCKCGVRHWFRNG